MPKDKSARTQIIVAIIGLVGALTVALITNWDKFFPPTTALTQDEAPQKGDQAEDKTAETLAAPLPTTPECGSTIRLPPEDHFFILGWNPVEGASHYTVEVDCFGCREYGRTWHSLRGVPWHIRTGLGLRSPIYSSKVHVKLREEGGLSLRWRVWGVAHDGSEGEKSEWCQLSYYGQ